MLKQVNEIVYLGVTLSQDPCAHVDKRMKATHNSFMHYKVQACVRSKERVLAEGNNIVVQDGNTALPHTWL